MTINWASLAIGSVLGATLGVVADWQIGSRLRKWSERRELTREYGSLPGITWIIASKTMERACRQCGELHEIAPIG